MELGWGYPAEFDMGTNKQFHLQGQERLKEKNKGIRKTRKRRNKITKKKTKQEKYLLQYERP